MSMAAEPLRPWMCGPELLHRQLHAAMDDEGRGVEEAEEIEPRRGSTSYRGYTKPPHSSGISISTNIECRALILLHLILQRSKMKE